MPSRKRRGGLRNIIFAVAAGQFFLPFMMSGVTTVLPNIGKEMNASAVELSLVIAIYTLSLTIFHLISGRIGDIIGRKRTFVIGFSLLIATMILLALAPNIESFLALRFIQAAGTGMMNTTALAILVSSSPTNMRGRVLSIASLGLLLGISCGPPIAGVVSATLGWRAMFLILAPVALLALLLMMKSVKKEWYDAPDEGFDWTGCLSFAVSICAFATGASFIVHGTWAIALLIFGIIGLILFVIFEMNKKTRPLIDFRFMFHNAGLSLGLLTSFINYGSVFGGMFYYSLFLQYIYNFSTHKAGMYLSIQPILQVIMAPYAGKLADKYGAELISSIGIGVCGVSLFLCSFLDAHTPLWWVITILIIGAIGMSLFGAPNTAAIMGSVDEAHLSQTSSLVGTVRTLGMLTNTVIVTMTMYLFLGNATVHSGNTHLFLGALHSNFLLFGALNLTAFIISIWRYRAIKAA